jgi:6-phospho-beta-glucosidase
MSEDMSAPIPPVPWNGRGDAFMRLAVIGGSTPFACKLISALQDATAPGTGSDVTWDVCLLGRQTSSLAVMQRHARTVLDDRHSIEATDDVGAALEGTDVVLVQPRIGGLEGRAADEDMAAAVGAPADEGLGPGGLRAVLRATPVLGGLASDLLGRCPDAFVLAFTNPLSSTVTTLRRHGVRQVAGVCELPRVTAWEIAAAIGVERAELSWHFSGLSHRGFIHDLKVDGNDVVDGLVGSLRERDGTIGGIGPDLIAEFHAVPLKYHLMLSGLQKPPAGRARQLVEIRAKALEELAQDPSAQPAALARRSMPWYDDAVVPLLMALAGGPSGGPHVLDVGGSDGVVREVMCDVSSDGAVPRADEGSPPVPTHAWLSRFHDHEVALNRLLAEPSTDNLDVALRLDPMTPASATDRLTGPLETFVRELADHPVAHTWLRA